MALLVLWFCWFFDCAAATKNHVVASHTEPFWVEQPRFVLELLPLPGPTQGQSKNSTGQLGCRFARRAMSADGFA